MLFYLRTGTSVGASGRFQRAASGGSALTGLSGGSGATSKYSTAVVLISAEEFDMTLEATGVKGGPSVSRLSLTVPSTVRFHGRGRHYFAAHARLFIAQLIAQPLPLLWS